MMNGSNMNDNLIKQHSTEQYKTRTNKHGLEKENTIIVKNTKKTKRLLNKIKHLFQKKNKEFSKHSEK